MMNEYNGHESHTLRLFNKHYPDTCYDHMDALLIDMYLHNQKGLMKQGLQKLVILSVKVENSFIIVSLANEYSLHWAANELLCKKSPLQTFVIYIAPPKYKVVAMIPIGFDLNTLLDSFKKENRDLNSINSWRLNRKGQSHMFHRVHIGVDARSIFQLKEKGYKISLGTDEIQTELIGLGWSGIEYGQTDGFQAVFKSSHYPYIMLGKEDAQKVAYHLFESKQKMLQKGRLPFISSITSNIGYIIVECANMFSLEWAVENLKDLELQQVPFGGNKMQFAFSAQIPTSIVPTFNDFFIRAMLEVANPELKTQDWKINLKKQKNQTYDVNIICDDEGAFYIIDKRFRLTFGAEEIKLRLIGKFASN